MNLLPLSPIVSGKVAELAVVGLRRAQKGLQGKGFTAMQYGGGTERSADYTPPFSKLSDDQLFDLERALKKELEEVSHSNFDQSKRDLRFVHEELQKRGFRHVFVVRRYSASASKDVFLRKGGGWTIEYPDAATFVSLRKAIEVARQKNADYVMLDYGTADARIVWATDDFVARDTPPARERKAQTDGASSPQYNVVDKEGPTVSNSYMKQPNIALPPVGTNAKTSGKKFPHPEHGRLSKR